MKVALCQSRPIIGDPNANADKIIRTVENNEADLYIFPELFLTDYTFKDMASVKEETEGSLSKILGFTELTGKTVICGGPYFDESGIYNSAYVISNDIKRYDKINLPNFGPFSERKIFKEGGTPLMFSTDGFRFGLIICYDIFFPELTKLYAMNGADAVICISASPTTSNTAFERVFPARSVESTVYMLFVNNIGERDGLTFFGKSRCLSPTGDLVAMADADETVTIVELDHESIEFARIQRPTIADTRIWSL